MPEKLLTDAPPAWGQPNCPLIPAPLRQEWRELRLPQWLAEEIGLEGSTVGDLGASVWDRLATITPRLERYVVGLLELKRHEIGHLRALGRPWPPQLAPRDLPWQVRTRNCLARAGLLDDSHRLVAVTFGDLFSIRAMGAKSVLDFACVSEAALEWIGGVEEKAEELGAELMDEPWIDLISEEDPRFKGLLPPGSGTLLQRLDEATSADATPAALATLANAAEGIRAKVREIEKLSLDEALRDYLQSLSGWDDARLEALAARLGWDGQPPRTLEESGQMIGVTRERIRQLQTKIVSKLPSHPILMPALDTALSCVAETAPMEADKLALHLMEKGISSVPFHPLSVLAAAGACGRTGTFRVERVGKALRVITTGELANASAVISAASRKASSVGVGNVDDVAASLEGDGQLDADVVREILQSYSEAEFLDEDWFWMPSGKAERNRLHNVTRRMLAVAQPLDIPTIREGLRRHYPVRRISIVPPRTILASFYEAHPAFELDSEGRVGSVEPIDYRLELGATERVLVDVFRRSPAGVLDRASLEDACEKEGMNLNTLSVYSTYSPILEHLGIDLWALRGVPVDPSAVEALRRANAQRPREKRICDYGWTPQGRLWVGVRMPRRPDRGLVVGIPGAIDQYVLGRRFTARAEDGSIVGAIAVDEKGTSWGYGPYLSRYGADEGDILRIEFDIVGEEVTLRLGGDELMDEAPAA